MALASTCITCVLEFVHPDASGKRAGNAALARARLGVGFRGEGDDDGGLPFPRIASGDGEVEHVERFAGARFVLEPLLLRLAEAKQSIRVAFARHPAFPVREPLPIGPVLFVYLLGCQRVAGAFDQPLVGEFVIRVRVDLVDHFRSGPHRAKRIEAHLGGPLAVRVAALNEVVAGQALLHLAKEAGLIGQRRRWLGTKARCHHRTEQGRGQPTRRRHTIMMAYSPSHGRFLPGAYRPRAHRPPG